MMALTMDALKRMGIHLAVTLANWKQKDSRTAGYLAHQTLTASSRAEHLAVTMVVMSASARLMDSTTVGYLEHCWPMETPKALMMANLL